MPHPEFVNTSPFACELLFVTDEGGAPLCVPLIQAAFDLLAAGSLELKKPQPPINLAGSWWGDPGATSMKLEPQIAFVKLGTDIVLLGHAYPLNADRTETLVGIRVGNVQKVARVFGDRYLVRTSGVTSISDPQPFDRIPLIYERAFGGWDRRHSDPDKHRFEPRNPVGMGYRDPGLPDEDAVQMPNIEDPKHLYTGSADPPPPIGFGFIAPDWPPRSQFAGTYDKTCSDTRKPLLPVDFDRRFFSSASPGLTTSGHLRGDESVVVIGVSENGRESFRLPGIDPPVCRLLLTNGKPVELQTTLDTLVVDMDERSVTLTWRAHLAVPRGVHAVSGLELPPQPPPMDEDEDED